MHTELIDGAGVPGFDKIIAPWLHRVRRVPINDTNVWNIGIRNNVQQIYRKITVHGARQHVDLINHFDSKGFTPVPLKFAKESGLDCVFCYEKW